VKLHALLPKATRPEIWMHTTKFQWRLSAEPSKTHHQQCGPTSRRKPSWREKNSRTASFIKKNGRSPHRVHRLPTVDWRSQWAPPPPHEDAVLSCIESPELGVVPPLRPQLSPRSPKKSGVTAQRPSWPDEPRRLGLPRSSDRRSHHTKRRRPPPTTLGDESPPQSYA
jgi:hypothetical protein